MVKFENMLINLTHKYYAQKEIKSSRMHLGISCSHLVQNQLPEGLLPTNVKIKILTTLALHVVLYGCEACFTRREEHRLTVFEIKVLRISGAKKAKVTRE